MQRNVLRSALYTALLAGLTAGLAACGGSSTSMNQPPSVSMPLFVSDASADDWATVGVRVLSIALVPQGGGNAVTVWTAPAQGPYINLAQLDQLGELLGDVNVPAGTYSAAIITLSGNPGDVALTSSADPDNGFPMAGGTDVSSAEIQIQHTQGSSGSLTVPVTVDFASPLTVGAGETTGLDLEFDLSHPAFIVNHTPAASSGRSMKWAVDFDDGPLHEHRINDLTRFLLRQIYGTVTGASNGALTITKVYPTRPIVTPETAVATSHSITINADGTNGTLLYDLDNASNNTTVKSFSSTTIPANDYVRVSARYQPGGALVAVKVWYSTTFNTVWLSPEGHVLKVDATNNVIWLTNEQGRATQVMVDSATQFFFQGGANPISTGTALLSNNQIVRGFKVHVTPVSPSATPVVAAQIDIETAAYGGAISAVSTSGFTYTSQFRGWQSNYTVPLSYIATTTPNGINGNGFIWWDFAYPTITYDTAAFVGATNGGVDFGGTVGTLTAHGASTALWGDGTTAKPTGWFVKDAELLPTPVPISLVSTAYSGGTFAITALGGTTPVTVNVSTTPGSATLVYEITRQTDAEEEDDLTVTPLDITTSSGLNALTAGLIVGAPVEVFGLPQAPMAPATTGTLKAYAIVFFAGTLPSMTGD